MSYADKIRMSVANPGGYDAVLRCIRIAMERAFIERGRQNMNWGYASQVARDIAALHGIDFEALRFDDSEQRRIRKLYWPDQQEFAGAGKL